MTPAADQWSVYSASQNLPAVLNDPNRGKQSNFFVKTWGDTFIEKNQIEKSPFLPEITYSHFDTYIRRIGKRYKRHLRLAQTHIENKNKQEIVHHPHKSELNGEIPEIFLQQDLPLNNPQVFKEVFRGNDRNQDHLLQEELSHYLDIVEVKIAKQVAQKSGAFFHAMTSHDTIMEQMGVACSEVRLLRSKVQKIDKLLAKDSLQLIKLARCKSNNVQLFDKLKLMSTVLQTQPTLQLLLSSSDYVGALELIVSTQEVLAKQLAGVTSLRHLPSQLKEMSKLIDKMLSTEFERYAAADLHRPLQSEDSLLEKERLISLVAGLLRQNHLQFLETYKHEAVTAVQTLLKQLLIEQLAEDETEHCLTGVAEATPSLDASNWLKILLLASEAFLKLIQRVKAVHDVIKETADYYTSCDNGEHFLNTEQQKNIEIKLKNLLISICDYCHERLASLISTQSEKTTITSNQIIELSVIVDKFTDRCSEISGKQTAALRAAFKIQAGNYVHKFHNQRKTKLTMLLDAERWKSAEVPQGIQLLVDHLAEGDMGKLPNSPTEDLKRPFLKINHQNYTTVGTVLILIQLVSEYCVCASNLPSLAPTVGRNLADLLRTFNSRCCQLVLGAGALRTAGLKTITSTNLALTSRSLQLVLWMMGRVRVHFTPMDSLPGFDGVERDIGHHIQQLETKVLSIMNTLLGEQLNDWDAKPPVPSKAFRNVSRHLTKLHEAVSAVLPDEQVILRL